jgi:protein tyrosine/serine phosphatase
MSRLMEESAWASPATARIICVVLSHRIAQRAQIVNDPANQPVYVHCVGGRHRTGVMTAAYRMTQDGWTADRAFSEMKQYKFGADFLHPELKKFVYAYRDEPAAPAASPALVATSVKAAG